MEFTLKVNAGNSNRQGTVDWVVNQLKDSNPSLSKTRDDSVCISAIIEGKVRPVCFFAGNMDDPQWDDRGPVGTGRVYARHPYSDFDAYHTSLFSPPLTPAAEKVAQAFIDECCQTLIDFLKAN